MEYNSQKSSICCGVGGFNTSSSKENADCINANAVLERLEAQTDEALMPSNFFKAFATRSKIVTRLACAASMLHLTKNCSPLA